MVARFKASGQPWAHGLANGRKYLLSGLTRCGRCGAAMYGQARTTSRGTKQRRYRCKGIDNFAREVGCGKVFRDAAALDEFITECVLFRFDSPEMLAALVPDEDTDRAKELASELAYYNQRRKTLAVEHAVKPYEDYNLMRASIMGEIQRVETELSRMHTARARLTLPTNGLRASWPDLSLEQQRDILRLVVEKITVKPGCSSKYWSVYKFDPDLIEITWAC